MALKTGPWPTVMPPLSVASPGTSAGIFRSCPCCCWSLAWPAQAFARTWPSGRRCSTAWPPTARTQRQPGPPFFPAWTTTPSIMARKVDSMVRKQFEPQKKAHQAHPGPEFLPPVPHSRRHRPGRGLRARQTGPPSTGRPGNSARTPELVAAIILVETKLGSYLGEQKRPGGPGQPGPQLGTVPDPALHALSGQCARASGLRRRVGPGPGRLGLPGTAGPVAPRHGQPARSLARIPGSIYGAIGICQFMPTNVLTYGVDGDGRRAGEPVLSRPTPSSAWPATCAATAGIPA